MEIEDLKSGQLVRNGTALLKISTVYDGYVTAQVLLEGRPSKKPQRTAVRSYTKDDVYLYFAPVTEGLLKKLEAAYC